MYWYYIRDGPLGTLVQVLIEKPDANTKSDVGEHDTALRKRLVWKSKNSYKRRVKKSI